MLLAGKLDVLDGVILAGKTVVTKQATTAHQQNKAEQGNTDEHGDPCLKATFEGALHIVHHSVARSSGGWNHQDGRQDGR